MMKAITFSSLLANAPLMLLSLNLQPGDQLLMVGNHCLQRLVRPLLEGGQGLLHLKTLR